MCAEMAREGSKRCYHRWYILPETVRWLRTGRQEVIGFGGRPHEVIGFGDLWGPSGTIWDLWGPSGDHLGTIIRRSYRFLVIFHQNMSFSAKTALFKFRMSFFKKVSIETAHQSKKLEKSFPKMAVPKRFYWVCRKNDSGFWEKMLPWS